MHSVGHFNSATVFYFAFYGLGFEFHQKYRPFAVHSLLFPWLSSVLFRRSKKVSKSFVDSSVIAKYEIEVKSSIKVLKYLKYHHFY